MALLKRLDVATVAILDSQEANEVVAAAHPTAEATPGFSQPAPLDRSPGSSGLDDDPGQRPEAYASAALLAQVFGKSIPSCLAGIRNDLLASAGYD